MRILTVEFPSTGRDARLASYSVTGKSGETRYMLDIGILKK